MLRQVYEIVSIQSAERLGAVGSALRAFWTRLDRTQRLEVLLVASLLIFFAVRATGASLGGRKAPHQPNTCVLIDAETGRCREITLVAGMGGFPMNNPDTGRPTLWPAEFCFSGSCAARGGTPVLLEEYVGRSGPTRCPRCGTPVVQFNGPPADAVPPADPSQEAPHVAGVQGKTAT